jgi:hypothetical protein
MKRTVRRKDAPKKKNEPSKDHWSDRYKILISVVAWGILIGSFVFLTWMGDALK